MAPESRRGLEPLAAIYHRACAGAIFAAFDRGVRRVTDALAGIHVGRVHAAEWEELDPAGKLFENMNTPADYEAARRQFEKPAPRLA